MDNQLKAPPTYTSVPRENIAPPKSSHSLSHHIWFSLISLILLVLVTAGIYEWQHHKVKGLETQVTSLNAEVNKLNAENSKSSTTKTSASTTNSSSSTCSANNMTASATQSPGAAGNEGTSIILTNTSAQSCTLYGYPTVEYIDSSGNIISNVVEELTGSMIFANPSPSSVTIAPGKTASFGIGYTEGGSHSSNAASMDVYLPGQSTAIKLDKAYGPSTANTGDPYDVDVTAIQLGSSPQVN